MAYIPVENLLKNANSSMYKLIILASRRARELSTGSEKLIDAAPNAKVTSIALREIDKNKVTYKIKKK